MEIKDFIKKWNVAYESKEQELEFSKEMEADLNSVLCTDINALNAVLIINDLAEWSDKTCKNEAESFKELIGLVNRARNLCVKLPKNTIDKSLEAPIQTLPKTIEEVAMSEIKSGAVFSKDGNRRFVLWRVWNPELPMVGFICLNPSTADGEKDDPTIRRIKGFAKDWGYGGVYMLNLFTMITAYPSELVKDDCHLENDHFLEMYGEKCKEIVFGWGNFKEAKKRAEEVIMMFPEASALEINQNGSPKHPLYVKSNIERVKFKITSWQKE